MLIRRNWLRLRIIFQVWSTGGELVFQKVTAAASLSKADIIEARLIENEAGYAVRISFSEAGKEKQTTILDEGAMQINLVMGDRILLTAPIPRPMAPPDYFTVSVQSLAEANELLERF